MGHDVQRQRLPTKEGASLRIQIIFSDDHPKGTDDVEIIELAREISEQQLLAFDNYMLGHAVRNQYEEFVVKRNELDSPAAIQEDKMES